jgi:hypothetical protein
MVTRFSYTSVLALQWERMAFTINDAESIRFLYEKKKNHNAYLTPVKKSTSDVKRKTIII